jgi:hypothetical protein
MSMRYASYPTLQTAHLASEIDGQLSTWSSGVTVSPSLQSAIVDGLLATTPDPTQHRFSCGRNPVPPPYRARQRICIGVTYRSHREETGGQT